MVTQLKEQGRRAVCRHRDRHELLDQAGALWRASRHPQPHAPRRNPRVERSPSWDRFARPPISSGSIAGCRPPQEGDVLLIATCGAYGYAMASNYNLRPPASEFVIEDHEASRHHRLARHGRVRAAGAHARRARLRGGRARLLQHLAGGRRRTGYRPPRRRGTGCQRSRRLGATCPC